MKNYLLPVVILTTSILYIFAIPAEPEWFKLLFKLIPMWLIIYYALSQLKKMSGIVRSHHHMIIAGLFFCMLGDGLLRWFTVGLTAFLIGHLFYLWSFRSNWCYSKGRFSSIIPLTLFAIFMGWMLVHALVQSNNNGLIIPVLIYIAVISLMVWMAIMTGNKWATAGSVLFAISDSILSWNMFVSSIHLSHLLIMGTYYTAQFCIAASLRSLGQRKNSYTMRILK